MRHASRATRCMNAVDTNVLIYAQDPRDATKRDCANSLVTNLSNCALLWQVACEYIAASRKLAPFGFSYADAWADIYKLRRSWKAASPSWEVHGQAQHVMSDYGISYWDSLLIAACAEAGVTTLYSEDFGTLAEVARVAIVNPFGDSSE
jgi:predicted nucleic acid-binding protein